MENLRKEDSFKIIQAVIDRCKEKYEQNGIFLILWGILIFIAGIAQYIVILTNKEEYSPYIWIFTMIPGAIINYIVAFRKGWKKAKQNQSSDLLAWIWALSGLLALLTGFVFGNNFGKGFTVVLYLPFCMAAIASALSLKNYLWISLSLLATGIAYGSFLIAGKYHPLLASSIALLLFLIPGIQLYSDYKKRQNV